MPRIYQLPELLEYIIKGKGNLKAGFDKVPPSRTI